MVDVAASVVESHRLLPAGSGSSSDDEEHVDIGSGATGP
jgi:hypothetical protein